MQGPHDLFLSILIRIYIYVYIIDSTKAHGCMSLSQSYPYRYVRFVCPGGVCNGILTDPFPGTDLGPPILFSSTELCATANLSPRTNLCTERRPHWDRPSENMNETHRNARRPVTRAPLRRPLPSLLARCCLCLSRKQGRGERAREATLAGLENCQPQALDEFRGGRAQGFLAEKVRLLARQVLTNLRRARGALQHESRSPPRALNVPVTLVTAKLNFPPRARSLKAKTSAFAPRTRRGQRCDARGISGGVEGYQLK